MTTEQWHRIKTIVQSILETVEHDRGRLIEKNCAGDDFLRAEVESLLDSYEEAGDFIETPAFVGRIKPPAPLARPGQRVGHYRVRDLIGRGGMGEVYLAEDTRLDRKVALKFLPAELVDDPERLARFEQEARAASALNHPNILTIHEIGEDAGTKFIATEYIEGPNPAKLTARRRAAGRGGGRDRHPDRFGDAGGSRGRDRSPRRQAGQHHGAPRRAG
jgi:hypothetical protein